MKQHARKRQIPFDLKEDDIPDIPEYCPVFPWIKLQYAVGKGYKGWRRGFGFLKGRENSVSVDRINNKKGYVAGNIRIISLLANVLKGRASDQELIALGKDAQKRNKA